MRTMLFPLLVFVGGSLVGPMLYWLMPLLPRYDLFYYGVGPLVWPVQLVGPLMDAFGTDNYGVLVAMNVLLFAAAGTGIVLAANKEQLLFAGALLEFGVVLLALSAVQFRLRDLLGRDGTMLIALLIALAFYGALVFLVRIVVERLRRETSINNP